MAAAIGGSEVMVEWCFDCDEHNDAHAYVRIWLVG
jgi:hypothetical protein